MRCAARCTAFFSLFFASSVALPAVAQEFMPLADDSEPAVAPLGGPNDGAGAVENGPAPAANPDFSDLVFLNDGTTLRGKIVRQHAPLFVEMSFEDGCSTTVAWSAVQRVEQPAHPNEDPGRLRGAHSAYILTPSLTPSFLWGENKVGSLRNGRPAHSLFAGGLEFGADLFLAAQMPVAQRTILHGIALQPSLGLYGGLTHDNVLERSANLFLMRAGGVIGYEFLQLWVSPKNAQHEVGLGVLVGYYAGYQLTKVYNGLARTSHDFSQGGVVQILAPHYDRQHQLLHRNYLQLGVYSVNDDVLMQVALGFAW